MKWNRILAAISLAVTSVGANADVLYTVSESGDMLCTIDTSTLTLTTIGPLGVTYNFGDLAYDTSSGTMYMTDGRGATFGGPSNRVLTPWRLADREGRESRRPTRLPLVTPGHDLITKNQLISDQVQWWRNVVSQH